MSEIRVCPACRSQVLHTEAPVPGFTRPLTDHASYWRGRAVLLNQRIVKAGVKRRDVYDAAGLATRGEREYARQLLNGIGTSKTRVEALEAAFARLSAPAAEPPAGEGSE